jgi:hypothetical protein
MLCIILYGTVQASKVKKEYQQRKYQKVKEKEKEFVYKKSKYRNVNWDKKAKKWRAQMYIDGRIICIGMYERDTLAAMAVNNKCEESGITLRNPNIDFDAEESCVSTEMRKVYKKSTEYKNFIKINCSNRLMSMIDAIEEEKFPTEIKKTDTGNLEKVSKYKHVNWDKRQKKWRAQIKINEKMTYIGLYQDETIAAMAVNDKCQELGIPLPHLNIDFDSKIDNKETRYDFDLFYRYMGAMNIQNSNTDYKTSKYQYVNKTSKYKHVNWDTRTKKWRAQMIINI